MSSGQNQREFFRLKLKHPLRAELKLIGTDGEEQTFSVPAGAKVCINDLSGGGLDFISKLDLPLNHLTLLEHTFLISGKEVSTLGLIVRKKERDNGFIAYGVQFMIDEALTSQLVFLINNLAIKLRKFPKTSDSSFCTEEELAELYDSSLLSR